MTVIRFDPFGDPFRQLDRLTSQLLSGTRTPMGMAMDVWQADDGYHAVLDLPGVDASSVEITSERNVLTIAAERRPEYDQGRFTRQLQLGENLDTQNVQARYANGVLHLTIPVAEAAQPRRIEVQGAGTPQTIEMSPGQGSAEPGSGDEQ